MLQIKNISKQYKTGDLVQIALNNVSLNFRDNEFVSILGPSGSGKTTLLNIIGGLDNYDKGDLIINNISTKKYKDRDWDSYRNHTIGFVFQSYNLIPHQTILANVELALTISGVSKKERRKRAIQALDKVGLKNQIHKKPNQMSGGQMQRVAIARALVNNPDILLADEPTGALDSTTSVQVMELLKEVANDRLVIMVTHNPELAQKYSTRIVNLKDGEIQGDTNPFNPENTYKEKPKHKNLGKSSMSLLTAFSLSLNNLLTKKGRSILTSFAGSIGIIGIALILALSSGFQNYVDKIQEDTLTSYPLTVQSETTDMASLLLSSNGKSEENLDLPDRTVEEKQNMEEMFGTVGKNDLKSFKTYLEENKEEVNKMVSLTSYQYSVAPTVYTKNSRNELVKVNPSDIMSSIMGGASEMMESSMSIFSELPESKDMTETEYEIVEGKFPETYNEVALVLPTKNTISDLLLYNLGLKNISELENLVSKVMKGEKIDNTSNPLEISYDELKKIELKLIEPSNLYKFNKDYNVYEDMSNDEEFMNTVYNKATNIISNITNDITNENNNSSENTTDKPNEPTAILMPAMVDKMVDTLVKQDSIVSATSKIAQAMTEATMQKTILTKVGELTGKLMETLASSFNIDTSKFAEAFKFTMDEDEIRRLMKSMSTTTAVHNADTNLLSLGYQNLDKPTSIRFYFKNFDSKELFLDFIDNYNSKMGQEDEEKIIKYTDITGLLMSSVKTIIDSVSYVLIAFVSISLIVSSIMIGIITYISVLERTKEIGILRAIGASKRNISSIFNAETFIVGLFSGIMGIGITILQLIPINLIIHSFNTDITAVLPFTGGTILVILSVILTLIGGLIPSRKAAKQDPVTALRTE